MFNKILWKHSFKNNFLLWTILVGGMTLFFVIPIFLSTGDQTLMFFGLFGLEAPIIFIIVSANKLVTKEVQTGSLTYVLGSSLSRTKILISKLIFYITQITLYSMFFFVIGIIFMYTLETWYSWEKWIVLILSQWSLLVSLGGICFFFSCWFNRTAFTMAMSSGVIGLFLFASLLGAYGPGDNQDSILKYIKYISLFTLFNPEKIAFVSSAVENWLWQDIILLSIGAAFFIGGTIKFKTKDLPL